MSYEWGEEDTSRMDRKEMTIEVVMKKMWLERNRAVRMPNITPPSHSILPRPR